MDQHQHREWLKTHPPIMGGSPEADDPAAKAAEAAEVEKQSFLDRLSKESAKRKDAEQRSQQSERELTELREKLEQRETAGLPELEQVKKDLARAVKRAEDAEQRAADQEQRVENSRRERLVMAAAADAKAKYPELLLRDVDLATVESDQDAKSAVKTALKKYPDLVKVENPQLPGQVIKDGKPVTDTNNGKPAESGDVSPLVRLEQAYAEATPTTT